MHTGCTARLALLSRRILSVIWKRVSGFIIYYPHHNFQFQAHGDALYDGVTRPAHGGMLPLRDLSNEPCQLCNHVRAPDAPLFIELESCNDIWLGFKARA